MEQKKMKKLSVRVAVYCIVLAAALCLVLGGLGYTIYFTKSMDSYKMYIESILTAVNLMVDAEDMENCILTQEKSEKYRKLQEQINEIKSETMVSYIYLIKPLSEENMKDIIYVASAFTKEEEEFEADELVELGDPVQENAFPDKMLQIFHESMFEKPEISYLSNKGEFGYMLTGSMPVLSSDGSTICLICIDFSMEDIYTTMYDYILCVLAGTMATAAVFLFLFIRKINKSIVRPIKSLARASADFVEQSHKAERPEELTFQKVQVDTRDELEYLSDSISSMMEDTLRYMVNLTRAAADKEKIAAELNVASQIQESMIPGVYPAFPERSELEIYGNIIPAREMGGAFYDYFFIDSTHFGLFIGDVNHTGIPAALMMVITRTMIKNYAQLGYGAAKVCQETNNQLSGSNVSAGMTITAFLGIIDLESGVLHFVNAGHRMPYLKRCGGAFEPLASKNNFALGSMANVPYWQQSVRLVQGDMLFLYTNGVTGVKDKKGEEFSESRIGATLNKLLKTEYTAVSIIGKFQQEVSGFLDGGEPENDIAALLFRYFGSE